MLSSLNMMGLWVLPTLLYILNSSQCTFVIIKVIVQLKIPNRGGGLRIRSLFVSNFETNIKII